MPLFNYAIEFIRFFSFSLSRFIVQLLFSTRPGYRKLLPESIKPAPPKCPRSSQQKCQLNVFPSISSWSDGTRKISSDWIWYDQINGTTTIHPPPSTPHSFILPSTRNFISIPVCFRTNQYYFGTTFIGTFGSNQAQNLP